MVDIQTKYAELFKHSCYAFCLCYAFSDTTNEWKWLEYISKGVQNGYITEDCFVQKPLEFIEMLCGTKYKDVEKPSIHKIEDIKELTIVEYTYNNGSHFVCVKDGNVVFDPSGYSMSVKYGIPFTYRKFKN